MKEFWIVYDPQDNQERHVFNNIDLDKMTEPLTIVREEPIQAEEAEFSKKKSEVVDYEDEEYRMLKEKEQMPYIITDSEMRMQAGKLQDISDSSSMYFILVNAGKGRLKMVPVSKWYGFTQRNQPSGGAQDAPETNIVIQDFFDDESESEHEVDYEAVFDDDDENDQVIKIEKEKKLTSSGRQLKGIVESYADGVDVPEEKSAEESESEEKPNKKPRQNEGLTAEAIRSIFGTGKVLVKNLLKDIKARYNLGDSEKDLIRKFIHENCTFETDTVTGEKMFKLKK